MLPLVAVASETAAAAVAELLIKARLSSVPSVADMQRDDDADDDDDDEELIGDADT